jgi:hypothetical protein
MTPVLVLVWVRGLNSRCSRHEGLELGAISQLVHTIDIIDLITTLLLNALLVR